MLVQMLYFAFGKKGGHLMAAVVERAVVGEDAIPPEHAEWFASHPPLTSAYAVRGAFAGRRRSLCVRGPRVPGPLKSTDGARTARVGAVTPTVQPAFLPLTWHFRLRLAATVLPVTGVSLAQELLFSCRLMIRSVSSTVPRYHQKIQSRKAGS